MTDNPLIVNILQNRVHLLIHLGGLIDPQLIIDSIQIVVLRILHLVIRLIDPLEVYARSVFQTFEHILLRICIGREIIRRSRIVNESANNHLIEGNLLVLDLEFTVGHRRIRNIRQERKRIGIAPIRHQLEITLVNLIQRLNRETLRFCPVDLMILAEVAVQLIRQISKRDPSCRYSLKVLQHGIHIFARRSRGGNIGRRPISIAPIQGQVERIERCGNTSQRS
ncbi:hypothetical protein D3C78_1278120 [compost metagenome]